MEVKLKLLESLFNEIANLKAYKDSSTGVSPWILQNIYKHLFCRTPPVAASVKYEILWRQLLTFFLTDLCHMQKVKKVESVDIRSGCKTMSNKRTDSSCRFTCSGKVRKVEERYKEWLRVKNEQKKKVNLFCMFRKSD